MSLVHGYSSDEGESTAQAKDDIFGLASLPSAKKIRVEETTVPIVPQAAPDVLAEVGSHNHCISVWWLTVVLRIP